MNLSKLTGIATIKPLSNKTLEVAFRNSPFTVTRVILQQPPRFVTKRADTLVYSSGDLLIDTQTGKWRRYSYPLRQRVRNFCTNLNIAYARAQELREASKEEVWPEGLVRTLSEYEHLINKWQEIIP